MFPYVGSAPVMGITSTQLLEVLRRIETRVVIETAHRALESCGQIFRYAIATGRSVTNSARDLKDALRRPEPQHFPAITDPKRLPRQAVAVPCDLYPLTGHATMVFRGERPHHRPMSENTINAALRAMGFPADEVTGHGFRATATMLHERLAFSPDVIEAQLAHALRDSLGRAYNRTELVEQRREMLQA